MSYSLFNDPDWDKLPENEKQGVISEYVDYKLSQDKDWDSTPNEEKDGIRNLYLEDIVNTDRQRTEQKYQAEIDKARSTTPGILGELGRSIGRGFTQTVPEQVGKGLQWLDPNGGNEVVSDIGKSIEQFGTDNQKRFPGLTMSQKAEEAPWYSPRKWVAEGGESIVQSVAPMAVGLAAGAIGGPVAGLMGAGATAASTIGKISGAAAGLGALGEMFYGGTAEDTYREGIKTLSDKDATDLANITGGIEGVGEVIFDAIPILKFAGLGGKAAKNIVKSVTYQKPMKEIGKDILQVIVGEELTESAQQAAQTYAAQKYGTSDQSIFDSVKEVWGPTLVTSLMFGMGGVGYDAAHRKNVRTALTNPKVDAQSRLDAINEVAGAVNKLDPEIAQGFYNKAVDLWKQAKPITIDDDAFYTQPAANVQQPQTQQQTQPSGLIPTRTTPRTTADIEAGMTLDFQQKGGDQNLLNIWDRFGNQKIQPVSVDLQGRPSTAEEAANTFMQGEQLPGYIPEMMQPPSGPITAALSKVAPIVRTTPRTDREVIQSDNMQYGISDMPQPMSQDQQAQFMGSMPDLLNTFKNAENSLYQKGKAASDKAESQQSNPEEIKAVASELGIPVFGKNVSAGSLLSNIFNRAKQEGMVYDEDRKMMKANQEQRGTRGLPKIETTSAVETIKESDSVSIETNDKRKNNWYNDEEVEKNLEWIRANNKPKSKIDLIDDTFDLMNYSAKNKLSLQDAYDQYVKDKRGYPEIDIFEFAKIYGDHNPDAVPQTMFQKDGVFYNKIKESEVIDNGEEGKTETETLLGDGVVKQPWEMSYEEVLKAVNPSTKDELEKSRNIIKELYEDELSDAGDPWGLVRAVTRGDELPRTPTVALSQKHKASILKAIKEGKAVPQEVLNEYPGLSAPVDTKETKPVDVKENKQSSALDSIVKTIVYDNPSTRSIHRNYIKNIDDKTLEALHSSGHINWKKSSGNVNNIVLTQKTISEYQLDEKEHEASFNEFSRDIKNKSIEDLESILTSYKEIKAAGHTIGEGIKDFLPKYISTIEKAIGSRKNKQPSESKTRLELVEDVYKKLGKELSDASEAWGDISNIDNEFTGKAITLKVALQRAGVKTKQQFDKKYSESRKRFEQLKLDQGNLHALFNSIKNGTKEPETAEKVLNQYPELRNGVNSTSTPTTPPNAQGDAQSTEGIQGQGVKTDVIRGIVSGHEKFFIGKNTDGENLYQNEKGRRYRFNEKGNIAINEPVKSDRSKSLEWKTVDEQNVEPKADDPGSFWTNATHEDRKQLLKKSGLKETMVKIPWVNLKDDFKAKLNDANNSNVDDSKYGEISVSETKGKDREYGFKFKAIIINNNPEVGGRISLHAGADTKEDAIVIAKRDYDAQIEARKKYNEAQEKENTRIDEYNRLRKVGAEAVPGVRSQDMEEAGRTYEYFLNGGITADEWYRYIDDLVKRGKVDLPKQKTETTNPVQPKADVAEPTIKKYAIDDVVVPTKDSGIKYNGPGKIQHTTFYKGVQDIQVDGYGGMHFNASDFILYESPVESTKPDVSKAEPAAPQTPEEPTKPAYGSENKIFTKERADKAREILRKKLGQLNAGFDPEIAAAGLELAGYHIEAGARTFSEYAKNMIADLGEAIRPYLKSFYNAVRDFPELDNIGMDSYDKVTGFDVKTFKVEAENGQDDRSVSGAGNTQGGKPDAARQGELTTVEDGGSSADQNVPSSESGNRGSGRKDEIRPGSKQVARQQAVGDAIEDGSGDRTDVVVSSSVIRDVGEERSSLGQANYSLTESSTISLTKGQRKIINGQVRELINRGGPFSDDEKNILRQYTGEGGLGSGQKESLNQHFTDYPTISAIYSAIENSGFKFKKALEPSGGSGNFVGMRPNIDWTTVDIDKINHEVLKALYPDARHYLTSFENLKANGFDLITSNVPFLEQRGADAAKNRPDIKALHDFYFVHALNLVKDNGIVAFITSRGTMDKKSSGTRAEIISKADILAAYRLPGGHFEENAHTSVITDIIFMQKRPDGAAPSKAQKSINDSFVNASETKDGIVLNEYYHGRMENMLGEVFVGKDKARFGKETYNISQPAELERMSFNYTPYETSVKTPEVSPSNLDAQKIPTNSQDFLRWSDATLTNYRVSAITSTDQRGNSHTTNPSEGFSQNIFIQNDSRVLVFDRSVEFTDVDGRAKIYKDVDLGLAKKIIKLQRIANDIATFQSDTDTEAQERAIRNIQGYQKEFNTHPEKDRELKSLFHGVNEKTFFAEISTLFKDDFGIPDSLSTRTRYTGSGKADITSDTPLKIRAFAAENNKGVIVLKTGNMLSKKDMFDLLDSGYSVLSETNGSIAVQNDILYYSGNVYQKIKEATGLKNNTKNPIIIEKLNQQIDALELIKPEAKTIEEINFKGGENWAMPILQQSEINIDTQVDNKGMRSFLYPGSRVYEKFLNNQQLISKEQDETTYSFMSRMREAEDFVWEENSRLKSVIQQNDKLSKTFEFEYNSKFRNYVKPEYDKAEYLVADVLAEIEKSPIRLRQNQVKWLVQAVYEGKGINSHDVGGGKTFASIALARALKNRGVAKKPLFVVPAKTIKKWHRDIKTLFPDAVVVDLGKLSATERNKQLFQLSHTNADYILVSHEGFAHLKLPLNKELEYIDAVLTEHVDDPNATGRESAKIDDDVQTLKRIITETPRDTKLTFDKLGIDMIVADEAHNYKNIAARNSLVKFGLGTSFAINSKAGPSYKIQENENGKFVITHPETNEVMGKNTGYADLKTAQDVAKGLPLIPGSAAMKSARSYDFRFKANYITDTNNGNNVFLLTATPTPNKPMEVYTMLRHLSPTVFHEYGIYNDTDFANAFFKLGTVENQVKNIPVNILRAIVNANELRGILNRYVDKISMENMPWIKVPEEDAIRHFLSASPGYRVIAEDLKERQQNLPKPPRAGDDTVISVYTSGRAASIDPRLYGGTHANVSIDDRSFDSDTDKIQFVIDEASKVFKENKNAGQLIFLDAAGFQQVERGSMSEDLHKEIKRLLVEEGGFKQEQIAIINGKVITNPETGKESGSGDKDQRKQDVADAYNAGKIKVILGSTTSMGEGMDLQIHTTDIWHLDIPFTPGAIRQRVGRGVRFGNKNDTVRTHYLLMRGTFDSMSLDLVMKKTGWNEAIWDKDVADTISTEEEMIGGAIPQREQILIELEPDPIVKAKMMIGFYGSQLNKQRGQAAESEYSIRTRINRMTATKPELEKILMERQQKLKNLSPNMEIKDKSKRAEAFEKSVANIERNIDSSKRHISEVDAKIYAMNKKLDTAVSEKNIINEKVIDFSQTFFDQQEGTVIVPSWFDVENPKYSEQEINGIDFSTIPESSAPKKPKVYPNTVKAKFKTLIDAVNAKGDVKIFIDTDPSKINEPNLRNAVMVQDKRYGGRVGAFFDPKTKIIYVFTDRARDMNHAGQLIAHELIGHHGLYEFMGDDLKPFLDFVSGHVTYGKQVAAAGKKRGYDLTTEVGKTKAAKEWFAELVELGDIEPSLMSRLIVALKNALRRWGFRVDFSREDLAEIIRGARKSVESPVDKQVTYRQQGGAVALDYATTQEVAAFRKANNLPEIKMRIDGSHPTQIATTKSTYKKIFEKIMPAHIKNGSILDYGAGKNIGGKSIGADTFEPFPEKGFAPTYKQTQDILSNSYDGIINNAVLNVVPDDIRDSIVKEIGRILKPNGMAFINVRGNDVFNAKHHVIDKSKMEVIIDGNRAYQKGFTQNELTKYLQETLGNGFVVENATGKKSFGAVGSIVTKVGSLDYATASQTDNRIDYAEVSPLTGTIQPQIAKLKTWLDDHGYKEHAEKLAIYLWDQDAAIEARQKELDGDIDESQDYNLKKRAMGKKIADELKRFKEKRIDPVQQEMADNKLKFEDVDELLHADHAPERNLHMKRINARRYIDAVLSNMTDAESAPYRKMIDEIGDELDIANLLNDDISALNEKRDAYVEMMNAMSQEVASSVEMKQQEIDSLQNELDSRVFTAEEEEKGTQQRKQKEIDNKQKRLDQRISISETWEDVKDRLSGMTNKRSKEIQDKWAGNAAIKSVADKLRKINADAFDMMHEAGELTDDEYYAMGSPYDLHVPLMREGFPEGKAATGMPGYGPLGKPIKIAAGSTRKVINISANIINRYEAEVSRKHKLESSRALYELVSNNQDESRWWIEKQKKVPRLDDEGNLRYFDENPRNLEDNEVFVKVDGQLYKIAVPFDNPDMMRWMEAVKRTPADLGPVLKASQKITRILAALNTSFSLEFLMTNFMRDLPTAMINLESIDGAKGAQKAVMKHIKAAIKGIYKAERGDDSSEFGQLYRDFSKHGGKIGWMQGYDSVSELAKNLEKELEYKEGKHPYLDKARKLGGWIEAMNTAVENGVRLSAYKVMVDGGMPKAKAAREASGLTVDFTRHGTMGPALNSLYMFANAGIQGNVRMIQALKHPKVMKIASGIVAFGATAAMFGAMAGGDDDDGEPYYDKLKRKNPELFERNMVFMIPGTKGDYFKIPMPYGYNTFFILGNEAVGMMRGQSPVEGMTRIGSALMNTLNPLASATLFQTVMPTIGDPIAQLGENKSWFGGDLMPKENPFGAPIPDSQRYFKSVNPAFKAAAQWVNSFTGGDKYKPGVIDVSPETLEMIVETYSGSAGRLIKDALFLPSAIATGDVEMNKVPFARKLIGDTPERINASVYRDNSDKVEIFMKRFKEADAAERQELRKDATIGIMAFHKHTNSELLKLNKILKLAEKREDAAAETKIKDRMLIIKNQYNKKYNMLGLNK